MKRKLIVLDDATFDIDHYAAYLNQGGRDVGERFLRAVHRAFAQIAAMPGIGSPWPSRGGRAAGIRCSTVPKFKKYVIVYRDGEDHIEILRVVHGSRDIAAMLNDEGRDPG